MEVIYNLVHTYMSNDTDLKWNNVISCVAHRTLKSDPARRRE